MKMSEFDLMCEHHIIRDKMLPYHEYDKEVVLLEKKWLQYYSKMPIWWVG
jgi:hypothetical protein